MGRHSRKGPVPRGADSGGTAEAAAASSGDGPGRRDTEPGPQQHTSTGYGSAQTRGGHPEQHEVGGGWGDWQGSPGARRGQTRPQAHPQAPQRAMVGGPRITGPRPEFVEAFDRPTPQHAPQPDPYASVTDWGTGRRRPAEIASDDDTGAVGGLDAAEPGEERPARGSRGRTFTGIAAAAVTTCLAVVVAGQVTTDKPDTSGGRATGQERGAQERPDRSDGRGTPALPAPAPVAPATFAQLMAKQFPIDPELQASGEFQTVPGFDKAPGEGRKIRYRVDVEKGLGLEGGLFAEAVQRTLNDDRSWAHGGAMTFERVSSGEAEFVITLASPGTTAEWCEKSGLDTTVDNVSCDSASTERVMINAFRWAQGADSYGPDAMFTYRQMLINHEVGHRLGHGHVNCSTPGALAPVMQQQTKSLDIDGVECRPNPWAYPGD
ncbi:DUF3152 domain-containing protein [Streptomyces sp. NPDC002889]|uniref:DUF3152 domain-containing protein n=1 Tax=Streptomyces sp. NPDC002889 TaxID=3364669 RepID=UPI003695FA79